MDNSFKRIFSAVTLVAMMAWTAGPALQPANAATLMAGDLIKSEVSSSVYYYGADGKRYVFPNEKTYKTWYSDFSGVKTITKDELAAISIGGNIVYRPGSRLIKITTDPKVYAVSPNGTRHWIKTEEAAKKLYGDNWAQLVDDVPDAFFFNYPTEGVALDGTMHPDGTIIKYASSSDLYLVWEGKKRKIVSDDAFSMNMLQTSQIVTSSDSVTYSNGDDISAKVDALVDTAQLNGSSSNNNNTSGGELMVALASDTPAEDDIPAGATPATDVKFTAFTLKAGSSDVVVNGLSVKRTGLSVDSDLTSVKLYDSNMRALGAPETFNANHKAKFNFTRTIPAGATQKFWIAGDNGTSKSGRIILGIESASDVVTNANVTGSFPVNGNRMTQVDVSVGSLTVTTGANNVGTATTVNVDEKQFRFIQAQLTAGSTEKVEVSNITFKKGDNATFNDGDLANFTLYNDTKGEAIATGTMDDEKVSFNLSPALVLDKGQSVLLSLKADVQEGSGRVVTFALRDNSTWLIQASGDNYGYGVGYSAAVNFGSGTADNAETANTTINTGTLTVSKGPNAPAADEIAQGGNNVRIGSFKFTAKGEAVKVDSMIMDLDCATITCADNTDISLFKLVDKDGTVWAGPYDPAANAGAVAPYDGANDGQVTFSDTMIFPVGETELFVEAKVATTANNGGTIQVGFENPASTTLFSGVKGQTSNKTITPSPSLAAANAQVSANTQTIAAGAMTIKMGGNPLAGNMVVGVTGGMMAEVVLDATAGGEDIKLTSLTFTEAGTSAMTDYANMMLKDSEGNQVGDTEEAASATTVVFNIDKGYVVPKDEVKKLYLYVDAISPAATETFIIDVTDSSSVGVDSGTSVDATEVDGVDASPTQTWVNNGTLYVQLDADNPQTKQMVSGTTGIEVARYKLTAVSEKINVTQLNLWAGNGATVNTPEALVASSTTGVKVYKGSTLLGSSTYGVDGKAVINITDDKLLIEKDDSEVISIKVDTNTKAAVTSNTDFYFGLGDANGDGATWGLAGGGNYDIDATGLASGSSIAKATIQDAAGDAYGGNQMLVYRGILTVSLNSSSKAGAQTAGANKEVARFDFTATGDDITINEIEFCVGGTATGITGQGDVTLTSLDESVDYAVLDGTLAAANSHDEYWTDILGVGDYYPLDPGVTGGSCFSFGDTATATPHAAQENTVAFAQTLSISEGTTKTVKLMGDTTGATTDQTLQIYIGPNPDATYNATTSGIEWQDVSGTDVDSTATKNLPLYAGTLTY